MVIDNCKLTRPWTPAPPCCQFEMSMVAGAGKKTKKNSKSLNLCERTHHRFNAKQKNQPFRRRRAVVSSFALE